MAAPVVGITPFNGKNDFSIWKQKTKCILIQQKVFKAVENTIPETESEDKKAEMNELARSTIILNLSDSVIRKVGAIESASELWKTLETLYTETSMSSRMYLLEKLFKFKLDLTKDIDDNVDRFQKLVQDIKRAGDKTIDEYTSIALMNAIPDSYSDVKAAIKYGRDSAPIDLIISSLKSKELELRENNEVKTSQNKALNVRGRSRFKGDNNGKQSNDGKKFNRGKSRSKSRNPNKNNRKCFNCGEFGHYKRECTKPKRVKPYNDNGDALANLAKNDDSEGVCFMNHDMFSVNSASACSFAQTDWLIDSGCTFHISPFKNLYSDFKSVSDSFVSMANDKKCKILGVGTVCLKFENGFTLKLENVKYVPDLCYNLLSCTSLEKDGFEGRWGQGVMKIFKGSLCVFKAFRKYNLYVCSAQSLCDNTSSANVVNDSKTLLWHNRLGHMSDKGLKILKKDQLLSSKDFQSDLPFCDTCVLGKQHRVSFPSPVTECISKGVLEYLHMDVWGPASVTTHSGSVYFLSVIDDFSRKVWCFLLKQKSDVFDTFKNWKCLIENQTGKSIKAIRTDNGLEFCNAQMDSLCVSYGIKRHKTVPYTPQQNGVAERMNRTLLEKVRCLLSKSGLSKKFWGEALLTACYLVNRSPSVPLKGKCPESVFSGKRIDLTHLRVFGCSAFTHQKVDKLDPRSRKGVFLGYPDGVKGYRVWLRDEPGFRVIISRDIVFNETEFPCLKPSGEATLSSESPTHI